MKICARERSIVRDICGMELIPHIIVFHYFLWAKGIKGNCLEGVAGGGSRGVCGGMGVAGKNSKTLTTKGRKKNM